MELFIDLFSKLQYGIAFTAVALLIVHALRPKVIALRDVVRAKALAVRLSVAEVTSSRGPSVSPMAPATME